MKPSRALAVIAAVSVVSGAVALRPRAPASVTAHTPRSTHDAANAATPPGEAPGIAPRAGAAGDFRSYAVDSRTFVTTDGTKPSAAAPPTLMLRGTWQETTAETGPGRSTLVVVFTPDEVAPETLSRDDLARPFVVELGGDGRVAAVAFARSVTGDARQALRALVAGTQLTAAADPEDGSWAADEEDTTGQYRAAYRTASPAEVVRRKDGYARVLSDRGLMPPAPGEAYAVDGTTRYWLDRQGAPAKITLREVLRITTGKDTPAIGALVALDAQLTAKGHGPVPAVSTGPSERLASLTAKPGSDAARDAQMAHGADFPALMTRLAEIDRSAPEERRRAAARAVLEARAVVRLDPQAAAEAARAMADVRTSATTASILGAALAAAGTAEARAALLQVARSDDADVRLLGVRALAHVQDGGTETLDALRSMLADADPGVATAASLALGQNLRASGGDGDGKAAAIDALTTMYQDAPDDATQRTAVFALGNAGGREALPVLVDALGDSAPIAEAATYALRYVPGDDVDQMLDGILERGSPGQRIAAVSAVVERDPSAWAPKLAALLQGDLPEPVRRAIVAALR